MLGLPTGDWIGIAGLVVSVVGFVLTLTQIVRTREATEAAREAAALTSDELGVFRILALIDRLTQIDRELMWAADGEDHKSLLHQSQTWQVTSSELTGLLKGRGELDLIPQLSDSARQADDLRQEFLNTRQSPSYLSQGLRVTVAEVNRDLARIAVRLQNRVRQI